jgi:hyaluronoglucosaminidase
MKPRAAALALVAVLPALFVPAGSAPPVPPARWSNGLVWPVPQQVTPRPDGFALTPVAGVVRDDGTDPAVLDVVTRVLRDAGVRQVRTATTDPGTPVTVWLAHQDRVLRRLRVSGPAGLPPEGYVLAAGYAGDRAQVVLDGVDPDGLFHAAQTFRQVVRRGAVPGVAIRDWPSMRYRGSIEGFYGTPWTQAERLDHLDYLAAHRMNAYEYSPKDDPYLRERWREPYPPDRLAQLAEVVDRARRDHLRFTYALSPGLSVCYSDPDDAAALLSKLDSVYALGARSFAVPLDDITEDAWHCPADASHFGTATGAAFGTAHAFLLNQVVEWARGKGDVRPVQIVPTQYADVADSPYKAALREHLDPSVVVLWTGTAVIPATITADQAAAARTVYGHEILVWDNYPVNDYIPGRLPLAAYTGRQPGLSGKLLGVLSNPANQPAVSKLALFSVAAFGWHDSGFDPAVAWTAALAELSGGDPGTVAALRVFADVSTLDGTLHQAQAPQLASDIARFWRRWGDANRAEPGVGGRDTALADLRATVDALVAAPARIRAGVTDPAFAAQAAAWLDATVLWGLAMRAAVDVLAAELNHDAAAAWAARQRVDGLVARAQSIRDTRAPHSGVAPRIGDGVVDAFLTTVGGQFNDWLAASRRPVSASSSLGTYRDAVPARMVDGIPDSYYSSDRPADIGDYVQVDLGAPHPLGTVTVLMGTPDGPDDYIHSGTLEYSVDGASWEPLTNGSAPEITAAAPAGTTARYVRYRSVVDNGPNWVAVREFTVGVLDR